MNKLWKYWLWSFQAGGTKLESFFWLKSNCIQMKLPNFENLCNGELSKLGINLENKVFDIEN